MFWCAVLVVTPYFNRVTKTSPVVKGIDLSK